MTNHSASESSGICEVVECPVVMVEVTRDDPEFTQLAGALSRDQALGFLSGSPDFEQGWSMH
jgi:hypothetical protein